MAREMAITLPAVEKGIRGAMTRGVLAGYPFVDVHVRLLHGGYHLSDSNALAFEIAGSLAFQKAVKQAGMSLLEPIMALEVVVPAEYVGDVIGNINARRGDVRGVTLRGNAQVVDAVVPLEEMFGYVPDLRGRTQGRGNAVMQPSHYAVVPSGVAAEVVENM